MKHVESLEIARDHPAYPDHFPGDPILPGVVLLDAALLRLQAAEHVELAGCVLSYVKFHAVVRPADPLRLEYEVQPNDSIRFSIHNDRLPVASGTLEHAR